MREDGRFIEVLGTEKTNRDLHWNLMFGMEGRRFEQCRPAEWKNITPSMKKQTFSLDSLNDTIILVIVFNEVTLLFIIRIGKVNKNRNDCLPKDK